MCTTITLVWLYAETQSIPAGFPLAKRLKIKRLDYYFYSDYDVLVS